MLQPKYEKFYFSMEAKQRFDGWSCSPALLDLVGYGLQRSQWLRQRELTGRERAAEFNQTRAEAAKSKESNQWMNEMKELVDFLRLAGSALSGMNE